MLFRSHFALCTYKALTVLAAPLGAAFISYSKRHDKPYGKRIFELLGCYKQQTKSCVWFHGASVGEINALKPLIIEFKEKHPNETIVVTTMTTTGEQSASKLSGVTVVFSPLDSPLAVHGFFKKFNPKALCIIDTELWPNMLDGAYKHGCKVCIVNARMQEKNCIAYLKYPNIVKDLIASKLSKVMCVSFNDKSRFDRIGVKQDNLIVTGNIKYDLKPNDALYNATRVFKKTSLQDFSIFGAISIHDGEEKTIIDAYLNALKTLPNLKLVFVPRHVSTAVEACNYLDSLHISYQRKSALSDLSEFNSSILIGDTLGEIEMYFGLCDLVFMGGSFVDIGGHNPLEPAYFSLPLLTGPDYHNFKEQFDKLIDVGGCYLAEDQDKLTKYICKLISNPDLLHTTGIQALDVQQEGRGALNRTLEQLDKLLYSQN